MLLKTFPAGLGLAGPIPPPTSNIRGNLARPSVMECEGVMGKKQKIAEPVTLPKPGEAFLMPLANGRFGVSRVLRGSTESEQPRTVRTASSWRDHPWMGDDAPDLKDGRIRRIQRLSHHSWKNQLDLTWVSDPPPESYQKLGIIEPSAADKRRRSLSSGGWFSGQHLHMN